MMDIPISSINIANSIGKTIWQFPVGGFDATSEDPITAARKELREETGVIAGSMHYLGSLYAARGFTNQKFHVCASNEVKELVEPKFESLEYGLVTKKVRIASINALVESGEMGMLGVLPVAIISANL